MNVTLCDICRKEIDMSSPKTKTINKFRFGNFDINSWVWHYDYDLCPECGKSLNEWIQAREKQLSSKESDVE